MDIGGRRTKQSRPRRSVDRISRQIREAYAILCGLNGELGWWPARTRVEIIVGAILTQNTAWANVVKATDGLRARGLLSIRDLREATLPRLQRAIRPAGYFRQKARKLKAFIALLDREYGGSLAQMRRAPTVELRTRLLDTWGIGPETADSILLYAFERPVFVVDTYTRRVATRHRWLPEPARYAELQELFIASLPRDRGLYNDYHAQLVWVGKHYCRTRGRCQECPLRGLLPGRSAKESL